MINLPSSFDAVCVLLRSFFGKIVMIRCCKEKEAGKGIGSIFYTSLLVTRGIDIRSVVEGRSQHLARTYNDAMRWLEIVTWCRMILCCKILKKG
jgi:hypothetical protein